MGALQIILKSFLRLKEISVSLIRKETFTYLLCEHHHSQVNLWKLLRKDGARPTVVYLIKLLFTNKRNLLLHKAQAKRTGE